MDSSHLRGASELGALDTLLLSMFGSFRPDPGARWDFRCHPSVVSAIYAADAQDIRPYEPVGPSPALYGHTAVTVDSVKLAAGEWELRREGAPPNSEPVLSGRLGSPVTWTDPQPYPASLRPSFKLDPPRDPCKLDGRCRIAPEG